MLDFILTSRNGAFLACLVLSLSKRQVSAMNTFIEISEADNSRFTFIETLTGEFVGMTGHGAYVYLNPVEIEQLFDSFLDHGMPVRLFARQCVKNVLNVGLGKRLQ